MRGQLELVINMAENEDERLLLLRFVPKSTSCILSLTTSSIVISFKPVSNSDIWDRFAILKQSMTISTLSPLNVCSKLSQKLISCEAVLEDTFQSSLVTAQMYSISKFMWACQWNISRKDGLVRSFGWIQIMKCVSGTSTRWRGNNSSSAIFFRHW